MACQNVKFIKTVKYFDDRGYFLETWNKKQLLTEGIDVDFVQDNQSFSSKAGTIRGLHAQAPPFAQSKLVWCTRGRILDIAVDIRHGSPNFGSWLGKEISEDNGIQVFIPEGFLHGFVTLEENTEVAYKCSRFYSPSHEITIRFDDPQIGIKWPCLETEIILSKKDRSGIPLRALESPFIFGEID
ncbi:dTDP-4-dehydrorhamnose 3,5-epimerase [Alphaproteobacteria bacterium]|nr:dTDP-4-dehydrorhamnose 3,5-epimerase [Alphaproteobacteria bacterium]